MSHCYLALDCATEACSVALMHDGDISAHCYHRGAEHARRLLPMIDALLAAAGIGPAAIDGIAFGRGPGGFTGLRIAAATAQGMAAVGERPLVPVSSLAAVAQGLWRERGVRRAAVAMDARMGEVYWGCFAVEERLAAPVTAESVSPPAAVERPAAGGFVGAGTGWGLHEAALRARLGGQLQRVLGERRPLAQDVLRLALPAFARGEGVAVAEALPVYLRDKVAQTTAERAGRDRPRRGD